MIELTPIDCKVQVDVKNVDLNGNLKEDLELIQKGFQQKEEPIFAQGELLYLVSRDECIVRVDGHLATYFIDRVFIEDKEMRNYVNLKRR